MTVASGRDGPHRESSIRTEEVPMADPRPVVVGVDGSSTAVAAVRWAAHEAARRACPLRVVHAAGSRDGSVPGARDPQPVVDGAVEEAVDAVGAAVPISAEILSRSCVSSLVAESQNGQLLVLGNRGTGGVESVLVGSVARSVTPRAACPVVLVRQDHGGDPGGRVVVGVDHRGTSDAALSLGFEVARARAVELVVVHAWRETVLGFEIVLAEYAPILVAAHRRWLTDRLAEWRQDYPDVAVREVARMRRPAPALVDAASGAALLVVGCRRRGTLRALVAGSVGQAVLRRAPCPVAVVPPGSAVPRALPGPIAGRRQGTGRMRRS
jgi:nucleotide-binding universal stress UspA family protein